MGRGVSVDAEVPCNFDVEIEMRADASPLFPNVYLFPPQPLALQLKAVSSSSRRAPCSPPSAPSKAGDGEFPPTHLLFPLVLRPVAIGIKGPWKLMCVLFWDVDVGLMRVGILRAAG